MESVKLLEIVRSAPKVTLRLSATGQSAVLCVWCGTVAGIGVAGHGIIAGLALAVLCFAGAMTQRGLKVRR